MDSLRESTGLFQRALQVSRHLVEERLRRLGIPRDERRSMLEVDRERHEVLLETVVQLALDREALRVGRENEALPGRPQLRDLAAHPFECFPLGLPGRQVVSLTEVSQPSTNPPASTVVVAAATSYGRAIAESEQARGDGQR